MRAWNYVPWDMPSKQVAMSRCEDDKQKELIEYYYSDEATLAIEEAGKMKDLYFERFPQIKQFIKDCTDKAKKRGWVKTWTGRRRHFKKPKEEGYKGPNSVIQGGCGDITKTRMWEIDKYLRDKKSRCINNIHDALMFEVHKSELWIIPELKRILIDLPQFSVPMDVEAEMSETSWGTMKHLEVA